MTEIKKDSRRKGQTESWVFQRILHRAQPHLTEQHRLIVGPWMIFAGVIVLMFVTAAALYVWTGQVLGSGSASRDPAPSNAFPLGTVSPSTATRPALSPGAVTTSSLRTPAIPQSTPTTAPPPPTATASVVKYRVKAGDTLLEIAIKYGVSVQDIMKANKMKNDVIRIGDELTIPPPSP